MSSEFDCPASLPISIARRNRTFSGEQASQKDRRRLSQRGPRCMFETAKRKRPSVPRSEAFSRGCHHCQLALILTGGQVHDYTKWWSHEVAVSILFCRTLLFINRRCGRAHAHRMVSCKLSVVELGKRCSPARLCMFVPCRGRLLRIARNKVRWSAAEAPESSHFETGPTRRAVCRHDLSCELGAGVQPTVPKRLLPSLNSRASVLVRHGVAQRSKTLVKE